eukprot:12847596-Alexandrium_andersonii.AAC.1
MMFACPQAPLSVPRGLSADRLLVPLFMKTHVEQGTPAKKRPPSWRTRAHAILVYGVRSLT